MQSVLTCSRCLALEHSTPTSRRRSRRGRQARTRLRRCHSPPWTRVELRSDICGVNLLTTGQMIMLVSCMMIARTVRPIPTILIVFPSHSFMKSLSMPGKRQTALVAIKALTLSMPGNARKKRMPVPMVCRVSKSRTRANSSSDGVS